MKAVFSYSPMFSIDYLFIERSAIFGNFAQSDYTQQRYISQSFRNFRIYSVIF